MDKFRSLLDDLFTFLFALVLAIAIWTAAVRANNPSFTQTLTLRLDLIARTDATLVSSLPDTVNLVIDGPKNMVQDLTPEDFTATLDLRDLPLGETTAQIQIEFTPPENINDRQIEYALIPSSINVNLEQTVTRQIPIVPNIQGLAARGYQSGEPVVFPDIISVTGPASRVNQIDQIKVTATLNNDKETKTFSVIPNFFNREGISMSTSGLMLNSNVVELTVPIEQAAGLVQKPITVNWIGEPAHGYRLLDVTVSPDNLLVSGKPDDLAAFKGLLTAEIDISGLNETKTEQVVLNIPENVQLEDQFSVFVTFEIEPILISTLMQKEVEIRGLGPNLTATVQPEQVRIFLSGPLSIIDNLSQQDITVSVDIFNLSAGSHRIEPITSILINNIEIRSMQPELVTVVITETIPITEDLTIDPETIIPLPQTAPQTIYPHITPVAALQPTQPIIPFRENLI